ncbi:hypothetical protein [Amycolatopsis sp. FDAARGOS 1241]|uniref:hypothetical protein n=1 Tax=Amycolatopsis sp. FDAARGOS 1241 TaxID=2778070 RepID=UPI001950BAC6|nr:hypothetical protein [Amycolatopsis sp. FDAARGOS 1241]QRP44283.1 hypothetical protein I6J71_34145 [Amycolatopsis sp. FDAARGOS 1241]
MGLFGRKRDSDDGGYEDNAALTGFGGYEPAGTPRFPAAGYGPGSPDEGEPAAGPAVQASGAGAEPGTAGPGQGSGSSDHGETPWYVEHPAVTGHAPRAEPRRIRPAAAPRLRARPSRALWVLVAVIGLGAAGFNFFGGRHHSTPSAPPRQPVTYQPEPRVVVPAVVPGWSSVSSSDGTYAYDVPPNWTPEPGVVHGWDPSATSAGLTLSTSAFTGRGYCDGDRDSKRGGAGVTTEAGTDAAAAARKAVQDLIGSAYDPGAKATYAPAQDATVMLDNTTKPAKVVVADVTPDSTEPCTLKHVTVGALALAGSSQSVVLVAYTDDTTGKADVLRLLRSYRGVPAADRSTTTPPPTTR